LEAQIRERLALDVHFVEVDLCGLIGSERDAALDALTTGEELPFVIAGDKVICTGKLDVVLIADSLGQR